MDRVVNEEAKKDPIFSCAYLWIVCLSVGVEIGVTIERKCLIKTHNWFVSCLSDTFCGITITHLFPFWRRTFVHDLFGKIIEMDSRDALNLRR